MKFSKKPGTFFFLILATRIPLRQQLKSQVALLFVLAHSVSSSAKSRRAQTPLSVTHMVPQEDRKGCMGVTQARARPPVAEVLL